MARIGNETRLILKLAKEKHQSLRNSRVQTPNDDIKKGYNRCFDDIWQILDGIIIELGNK